MEAQEQKQQRREVGLQASISLKLSGDLKLRVVLLHGFLPGFIPALTTGGGP